MLFEKKDNAKIEGGLAPSPNVNKSFSKGGSVTWVSLEITPVFNDKKSGDRTLSSNETCVAVLPEGSIWESSHVFVFQVVVLNN